MCLHGGSAIEGRRKERCQPLIVPSAHERKARSRKSLWWTYPALPDCYSPRAAARHLVTQDQQTYPHVGTGSIRVGIGLVLQRATCFYTVYAVPTYHSQLCRPTRLCCSEPHSFPPMPRGGAVRHCWFLLRSSSPRMGVATRQERPRNTITTER